MKSKKRKIITIESWSKTVIRKESPALLVWCEQCGIETQRFTPEEFAQIKGITARIVYQRIENGDFHFIDTNEGLLLICSASNDQKKLPESGGDKFKN